MSTLTEEPTINSAELNTDSTNSVTSQVLMIEDIQKLLPHRYPFLLVDRIIDFVQINLPQELKMSLLMNPSFKVIFLKDRSCLVY